MLYLSNELLIRLKKSGLWGVILVVYLEGAFGYADDVTLLSATRKSMNLTSGIA